MRSAALLLAAAWLAACSSDPYSFSYRPLADPARAAPPAPAPGPTATLTVRREPSMGWHNADYWLVIDGARAVELDPGEQYSLPIAAGQHVIGSDCRHPFAGTARNDMSLDARPGRTYIVRIYTSFSEPCLIAPMSQ